MSNIKVIGVYSIAGTFGIEVGNQIHETDQIRWRYCESKLNPDKWKKAKIYYTKIGFPYFNTPIGRVRLDRVMKL